LLNASSFAITVPARASAGSSLRSRVHRHEHVGRVARREDVLRGEVDLERRDAGERAGRRADLRREARERREVVAVLGGGLGEAAPGELHTVT
jgi:hypothetical protein